MILVSSIIITIIFKAFFWCHVIISSNIISWIFNKRNKSTSTNLVTPILVTSIVGCILSGMSIIKGTSCSYLILSCKTLKSLRSTPITTVISCSFSQYRTNLFWIINRNTWIPLLGSSITFHIIVWSYLRACTICSFHA